MRPAPRPKSVCVAVAEPFATAAKGFAFVLFTQIHEEGERVISAGVST